jgi:excisionase family DNA binding protein
VQMDNARAHAAIHARVFGPERGRLLRPTEVARRLGVHRNTVYRWIEGGHLPAFQLGGAKYAIRVDECELDRWLHEQGRRHAVDNRDLNTERQGDADAGLQL